MTYENTPRNIFRIIEQFDQSGLRYNLFKCEHIFEGSNSNLDILFKTKEDFFKAAEILEEEGYVLYMSEKVEKYKLMYVKFHNHTGSGFKLSKIHLHREVAWHGLKILDKNNIFERQDEISKGICVPSNEDSLIIHIAHIIFENFVIRDYDNKLIKSYLDNPLNWEYINRIVSYGKWNKCFYYIIDKVKTNSQPNIFYLLSVFLKKTFLTPSSWFPLTKKIIFKLVSFINLKRKGTLIAFVGMNGSGKSTATKELLLAYQNLTKFMKGQIYYYYGWRPFSVIAKLISSFTSNKKIFKKINESKKIIKFSLFQEGLFIYIYFDYLLRYLFHIYPELRKGKLVISDRYFYDIYGQYPYASRSLIAKILMHLFPKPNKLIVLDAPLSVVLSREKKGEKRKVKSERYLKNQKEKYLFIAKILNGSTVDTACKLDVVTLQVVDYTWKDVVRRNF